MMVVSLLVALIKDKVASCSSREFNFKFRLTRNQDRVYRPFPSLSSYKVELTQSSIKQAKAINNNNDTHNYTAKEQVRGQCVT